MVFNILKTTIFLFCLHCLKDENLKISPYKIKKISSIRKKNNPIRSFKRQIENKSKEPSIITKIALSWRVRWKKDTQRLPIKEKIINEGHKTKTKD